jgi:hypothetical protein
MADFNVRDVPGGVVVEILGIELPDGANVDGSVTLDGPTALQWATDLEVRGRSLLRDRRQNNEQVALDAAFESLIGDLGTLDPQVEAAARAAYNNTRTPPGRTPPALL